MPQIRPGRDRHPDGRRGQPYLAWGDSGPREQHVAEPARPRGHYRRPRPRDEHLPPLRPRAYRAYRAFRAFRASRDHAFRDHALRDSRGSRPPLRPAPPHAHQ
jgi:hypothetical protein